jgi:hypothetical protein
LKHIRFAEPIATYRQFAGSYRRLQMFADDRKELQELAGGCRDLQKPIRICKELQGLTVSRKEPQSTRKTTSTTAKTVKRIGAIQVFCPRPSKAGDLATGEYRLSTNVDSFSFT